MHEHVHMHMQVGHMHITEHAHIKVDDAQTDMCASIHKLQYVYIGTCARISAHTYVGKYVYACMYIDGLT